MHIMSDDKLFNDVQKINYAYNDLGAQTVEVLQQMLRNKHISFPLTHLSLVGVKLRVSTIDPLLKTLTTKEN